jgi:Tat protein secretion system quality control protein TatD with DNase activity
MIPVKLPETGLDRYWDHTAVDQQVVMFEQHNDLARRRRSIGCW